uniref:Uncharacterized protein n=2 Tax=Pyricularia oryzae TaxID=318829 RepID=Q2KFD5_PYRO7|nr:hypothetical protein MGCH7_ch7g751 [Pyricularia oryzae 70-15]
MCDKTWEFHHCKEQCADESTVQIVKCNNINCNYRRFGKFDSEKSWGPSFNKCPKHGYYNPHDRCRSPTNDVRPTRLSLDRVSTLPRTLLPTADTERQQWPRK